MKLYIFRYESYGHNELLAIVIADSEKQARLLIDADAKEREDTVWPDDHFQVDVYDVGQVAQFVTE